MNEEDGLSGEAAATGILHCLRMLADEAASLHLIRTVAMIRDAIEICAVEKSDTKLDIEEYLLAMPRVLH